MLQEGYQRGTRLHLVLVQRRAVFFTGVHKLSAVLTFTFIVRRDDDATKQHKQRISWEFETTSLKTRLRSKWEDLRLWRKRVCVCVCVFQKN